ncbi:SCO7613 C-terminal domain-containing membrane protein [Microbacterium azadirachtae]|uniref:Uncharacterized protein n=1 Tax=Microbacterium azadirachtae TaxID=582680 RepID=A0A0F0LMG3_9MICO|nr:hypothetical protein [Microbacterium azadirachtae]KJL34417.1 hypothetical protein RS86_00903 [Microbacterium azadirachtae]
MTATAAWAATALGRLRDDEHCPVCDAAVVAPTCPACGADFRGQEAQDLWSASQQAAVALAHREQLVAALPRVSAAEAAAPLAPRADVSSPAVPVAGVPGTPIFPPPALGAPAPERSTSLQSLLSVAGAGLFGTAAIVFSFFTPDLAAAARTAIVGATGALFVAGAVLLARRGLRFSAETVAALALVFAGLAAQGVVAAATGADPWLLSAVLTAAGSAALLAVAGRARLRVWFWAGTVGLAVAPAMLAGVAGIGDGGLLAILAVAFVALAEVAALPRLGARFLVADATERPDTAERPDAADRADTAERPDAIGSSEAEQGPSAPSRAAAPFDLERGSLIVAQAVAVTIVMLMSAGRLMTISGAMPVLALTAMLVCVQALLATRNGGAIVWSIVAGVAGAGAPVLVALSIAPRMGIPWFLVSCAGGVGLGLVLLGAVLPLPRTARPVAVVGGALGVLAAALAPGGLFTALAGGSVLARLSGDAAFADGPVAELSAELGWALVASLVLGAAALGAVAVLARRRTVAFRAVFAALAIVPAALAVLALGASPLLATPIRIGLLLVAAVSMSLVVRVPRRVGEVPRILLLIAAHIAVVLAAFVGAEDPMLMPLAGAATLLSLLALGAALPRGARFLLVGAGFGYALVVLSSALALTGIGGVALLSLTATTGLLVVAAVTALRSVPARSWQAMLAVASVPFAIGVAQVLIERSGWTALPTAAMAVLAALLLQTRREGASPAVRLLAAAVIVPALAVSVLCLGAQVLPMSASPVVLPVIAALVAAVLPCTRRIRRALADRGVGRIVAARIQTALEAGALLTGALAVVLALVREAAGFGTACAVLALLSAGAGVAAATTGRRHLRAVAAVAATGALWSGWAALGVTLAEAYLLPPALAAVAFGTVRALRGGAGAVFAAVGSVGAVVPVLALIGAGTAQASLWRAGALLAASWLLAAVVGVLVRSLRRSDDAEGSTAPRASVAARRLRPVASWLAAASLVAGLAGAAQAILLARGEGLAGLLPAPLTAGALFFACVGLAAVGGAGMAAGAAALRAITTSTAVRGSRWLFVPALAATTAGVWPAIQRDWLSIWGMWSLMLVLLAAMVLTARRAVRGASTVAPVWILFALAFVTAVVAWSPRDLRVEWFSLPLGLFLIAAGMQGRFGGGGAVAPAEAGRAAPDSGRVTPSFAALHDWPRGASGSWALLAPGIVVTMIASVVSTFTDPLTERAILVMVCALIAILVGATRRLAAPFLIGLIVLPIENVFVFAVQIGRGIESMPWWITLAVMGAVLLIIATTAERRAEHAPVAARLRDLR